MATVAVQHAPITPSGKPQVQLYNAERGTPYKPHDVLTTLYYYKDPGDGTPPAPSYVGKPETFTRPAQEQETVIKDITGREKDYTLDSHGFQLFPHTSEEKRFVDDEKIKHEYYEETEDLLRNATGATRVFIFDHTIRRPQKDSDASLLRGPVRRVHIDQSYTASRDRVFHHLPDEAASLVRKRYQIINVWRPVKPIFKDPLAIASAPSVPDTDLVPVPLIYPHRRGETYTVKPNPRHEWFYKYGQLPSEVMLIKCFDSWDDGRARRVPHSAFVDPGEEGREERESIEVRALVFYDE